MAAPETPQFLAYRRSNFTTALPVTYRYTPGHAWLAPLPQNRWRVGLTKFATRMLGELVEHEFQVQPGQAVKPGQVIGWLEGFKAITDLYCVVDGTFECGNPALMDEVDLVSREPYGAGWLYEAVGQPDAGCLDVTAYRDYLDDTIDRLLAQERAEPG